MKKARIILPVASGIVLLLVLILLVCLNVTKQPVIAFHNVDNSTQEAVQAALGDTFTYKIFDSSTSLSYQIKKTKAKALITKGTANIKQAKELASKKALLPLSAISGMSSSIRSLNGPVKNDLLPSLPLLIDHMEVNIDNRLLKATKVNMPNTPTWTDLTRFATVAAGREYNPKIVFAGKDSTTLIDIIGALAESLDGRVSYDAAVQLIQIECDKAEKDNSNFDAEQLADALAANPSAPLFTATQLLSQWYSKNLLYPDVFNLSEDSLNPLMEMNLASMVLMPLSLHRKIDQKTIENFTSIYFPSYNPASNRFFTAPVVFALPLSGNKEILAALTKLSDTSVQEQLSRASGLAPVLSQCRTPDRQADNVRYWVAATNSPLAGLSTEVALTTAQKEFLARALKALIMNPKN